MKERDAISFSGWFALLVGLGSLAAAAVMFSLIKAHQDQPAPYIGGGIGLSLFGIIMLSGCMVIGPNDARVMTFFGRYTGSVKTAGLRWINPFTGKRQISLRARNFETAKIKVNDLDGNPIEIGAVIVWRVVDTSQATFDVESFVSYVQIQAESAMRNLAMHHPYDSHDDNVMSLRGQSEAVAEQLRKEVNERIKAAGCEVIDARIAHLAYAPEIAQAMLQRQQAGAIIAARQRIVEGAVSMVEMALEQLARRGIVELDPERKAAMVSNLLVVLCGERSTQPVVNAGSLY
ncbi:MAG: SPFH domain-containing protein [Deltaproteobacteria bacterium]|nr:SPFH domain-containing protein [Deltaproteobacteria bacterium]MCW5807777.1 SPFH domain-containing protein [Deltaproteobacteria bacterium]